MKSITLTELLVTIAIIAIIAGVSVPAYRNIIEKHKDREAFAALEIIAAAENRYYLRNNRYIPLIDTADINEKLDLRLLNLTWLYKVDRINLNEAQVKAQRYTDGRMWEIDLSGGLNETGIFNPGD